MFEKINLRLNMSSIINSVSAPPWLSPAALISNSKASRTISPSLMPSTPKERSTRRWPPSRDPSLNSSSSSLIMSDSFQYLLSLLTFFLKAVLPWPQTKLTKILGEQRQKFIESNKVALRSANPVAKRSLYNYCFFLYNRRIKWTLNFCHFDEKKDEPWVRFLLIDAILL